MTLTRLQALIIAAGLALVGVAVARAGTDTSPAAEQVQVREWRHFADSRVLREGRTAGAPADFTTRPSFSRL